MVIFSTHGLAWKKDFGKNELYMNIMFIVFSTSFETLRFSAFCRLLQICLQNPNVGLGKLLMHMILNICLQAYNQTDLCFVPWYGMLKKKFGGASVNPQMACSWVSAIQEYIRDKREFENTKRQYYAFVWSTTFRIPTFFCAYVLLYQIYGLTRNSPQEYLYTRWILVLGIYMAQEVAAEILCRIVEFVLSRKWTDYRGRVSYPEIMLKYYQKEGIWICAALYIAGSFGILHNLSTSRYFNL